MTLDLGRLISHSLSIAWRHRWLWLLGVFGGVAGGFNFRGGPAPSIGKRPAPTADQVGRFVGDHLGLVLAAVAVVLVIWLVAFLISCVAVPASIWAGLELDAGRVVGLRAAWREGRARFWRYLRLALLKLAIGLGIVVAALALVLLGAGIFRAGGNATLLLLVPVGLLLVLVLVAASILARLGMTWSDRLLVILELSAVDSVRAGWWLFRHSKADTVVFGIALYVVRLVFALLIAVGASLVAVPGILMVVGYFTSQQATVGLLVAGITWILILGGGVELVGAGFLGALTQVGYALAARDLTFSRGLQPRPGL